MDRRKIRENFIISKLSSWRVRYEEIKDDIILEYVYDLYMNDKYIDCDDKLYLNYAGIHAINNYNYRNMAEIYFLMAIKEENIYSMHNLAFLYRNQGKYELARKYYLMAIDRDNIDSMRGLALLYDDQKKTSLPKNII